MIDKVKRISIIEIMNKIAKHVDMQKFLDIVMTQPWHKDCEIIPAYKPEYLQNDESYPAKVAVRYNDGTEHPPFLRKVGEGGSFMSSNSQVSNGVFWDIYGDDFESAELALIGILKAPQPTNVGPITFSLNLNKKD